MRHYRNIHPESVETIEETVDIPEVVEESTEIVEAPKKRGRKPKSVK